MKLFLRVLRILSAALWVGGIAFFAFVVAPTAFKVMPDAHQAGMIVRGTLLNLHRIGLFAGSIYLFATLALLATQYDSHPARAAEIVLVVSMIALTLYLQQSVLPRMETDRLSAGGDIEAAQVDLPARLHFERLHKLSEQIEGTILFEGLLMLCLAPVHARDLSDTFA